MTCEQMKQGHYYWRNGQLFVCETYISKAENGYGNVRLRRVHPEAQVSGAWYCFKNWPDDLWKEHNP